jgi:hypothetical protein
MPNQLKKTSDNQQHYNHHSEGDGWQIHNVLIGFAPMFWDLSHLNSQDVTLT